MLKIFLSFWSSFNFFNNRLWNVGIHAQIENGSKSAARITLSFDILSCSLILKHLKGTDLYLKRKKNASCILQCTKNFQFVWKTTNFWWKSLVKVIPSLWSSFNYFNNRLLDAAMHVYGWNTTARFALFEMLIRKFWKK